MERTEFIKLFRGLLAANNPVTEIDRLLEKAIDSGAVNLEGEPEDSYRLCKVVYYAILCELCEQWIPLDTQNRQEAENLKLFL